MRKTEIATLKIERQFYEMILRGEKKYEVRASSLEGVDAICFIDSRSKAFLGYCLVDEVALVDRGQDAQTMMLSGISPEDFERLFPDIENGGPITLWVAHLEGTVSPCELLEMVAYGR